MYKYSHTNEDNSISLHDSRAEKISFDSGVLTLIFKDGFYVDERNVNNFHKKLCYTGRSEVGFKTLSTDIDLLRPTQKKGLSEMRYPTLNSHRCLIAAWNLNFCMHTRAIVLMFMNAGSGLIKNLTTKNVFL